MLIFSALPIFFLLTYTKTSHLSHSNHLILRDIPIYIFSVVQLDFRIHTYADCVSVINNASRHFVSYDSFSANWIG